MESHHHHQIFDHFVKLDKPISRFYTCFRTIAKFRHLLELFIVLGLISWSSPRVPPLLRFSTYLFFNHHVVFLIGNSIIFMLFLLCRRQNDAAPDFYDDYIKHSDDLLPPPAPAEEDAADHEIVVSMSATIEKARRQIKRFERTQSEKLKREIRTTPAPAETFERLSSEEFRRRIDAFIDENWKTKKKLQFDEYQKFQMAY